MRTPVLAVTLSCLVLGIIACDDDEEDESPGDAPAGSVATTTIAGEGGAPLEPGSNLSTPASGAATTAG